MNVLVCDDESLARQRLIRMLDKITGVACIGEATNGRELLAQVQALSPDVVITDIRMPGMDGLEAAAQLVGRDDAPAIVFCTAYDEHALRAFEVQAIAYLLKPVKQDALDAALRQAQRLTQGQWQALARRSAATPGVREAISARTHRGLEVIPVQEIRYFMADHKYVTVRHVRGEVLIDDALRDLEEEFAGQFVRIHRNCLISIDHVDVLMQEQGHTMVRLRDIPDALPVSRRLLPSLRRVLR